MSVLVIDDSRAIRTILRRYLQAIGHSVLEAGNGIEALSQVKLHTEICAALVDWNMPEMNGFDFIKTIRADRAYSHLKLIMVTTETEMAHVTMALEAGADEYIMKPFTQQMIEEKLQLLGVSLPNPVIGQCP